MAGEVQIAITAQEANAIRGIGRVVNAQKRLARIAKETGRASSEASKEASGGLAAQSAASNKVTADLGNLVLKYASVGAVIGTVRGFVGALTDAWNENAAAAEKARGAAARFQALGAGTPEERRRILSIAGVLGKDPSEAFNLAFTAQSAGLNAKRREELFRELQSAAVIGEDPAKLGRALIPLAAASGRSIRQLSSFTREAAKQSDLDQAQFAGAFARIQGVAGQTSGQQAASAALLAPFVRAEGGEEGGGFTRGPVALKGFLAQAIGERPQALFARLGIGTGATSLQQIQALSEGLEGGQVTEAEVVKLFGRRVGPTLLAVARGQGLDVAEGVQERLAGILERPGGLPSILQQEAQAALAKDPEQAALFEAEQIRARRELRRAARGFRQAPIDLRISQIRERLRVRGGGVEALGALREVSLGQIALPGGAGAALGVVSDLLGDDIPDPLAEFGQAGITGGGFAVGFGAPPPVLRAIMAARGGAGGGRAEVERFLAEGGSRINLPGNLASQSQGQAEAAAALRLARGGGQGPTAVDILTEAGGFVDPAAGTRELIGTGEATPTRLGRVLEGLTQKLGELRAPTIAEPDES